MIYDLMIYDFAGQTCTSSDTTFSSLAHLAIYATSGIYGTALTPAFAEATVGRLAGQVGAGQVGAAGEQEQEQDVHG